MSQSAASRYLNELPLPASISVPNLYLSTLISSVSVRGRQVPVFLGFDVLWLAFAFATSISRSFWKARAGPEAGRWIDTRRNLEFRTIYIQKQARIEIGIDEPFA